MAAMLRRGAVVASRVRDRFYSSGSLATAAFWVQQVDDVHGKLQDGNLEQGLTMAEEEWRRYFLMVVNFTARRPGSGENSGEGGKRKKLGL